MWREAQMGEGQRRPSLGLSQGTTYGFIPRILGPLRMHIHMERNLVYRMREPDGYGQS